MAIPRWPQSLSPHSPQTGVCCSMSRVPKSFLPPSLAPTKVRPESTRTRALPCPALRLWVGPFAGALGSSKKSLLCEAKEVNSGYTELPFLDLPWLAPSPVLQDRARQQMAHLRQITSTAGPQVMGSLGDYFPSLALLSNEDLKG